MRHFALINKMLRKRGYIIVTVPPSAKSLTEAANVLEVQHRGRTTAWLRQLAELLHPGGDQYKQPPSVVAHLEHARGCILPTNHSVHVPCMSRHKPE